MWHLIRENTVRLPRADLDPRAETNPSLAGIGFWWGSFGLNCAQMVLGEAELGFGLRAKLALWDWNGSFNFQCQLGNELVQSYHKTNEQALLPSEISDTDQNFEKEYLFENKPTLTRRLRRESCRHEQGGQKVPKNPSNQPLIGLAGFLFTWETYLIG